MLSEIQTLHSYMETHIGTLQGFGVTDINHDNSHFVKPSFNHWQGKVWVDYLLIPYLLCVHLDFLLWSVLQPLISTTWGDLIQPSGSNILIPQFLSKTPKCFILFPPCVPSGSPLSLTICLPDPTAHISSTTGFFTPIEHSFCAQHSSNPRSFPFSTPTCLPSANLWTAFLWPWGLSPEPCESCKHLPFNHILALLSDSSDPEKHPESDNFSPLWGISVVSPSFWARLL